MNLSYSISSYSFKELAVDKLHLGDEVITAVEQLAGQLAKEIVPKGDDYLKDKLDYREFILRCKYGPGEMPDFGRIFLAKENWSGNPAGFALCIDNIFKSNKKTIGSNAQSKDGTNKASQTKFPLSYCNRFFAHDTPYLKDLDSLGHFSYCFQLGVDKAHQGTGCAGQLMDEIERFYSNKVLLLAASIHENQHNIIRLLHHRNEHYLPRHKETGKDYFYLFLDHYFNPRIEDGHWFRVVQILDNRQFVSKINYHNLPKAYNTIIPIQLNQAIINVNKIIHRLGAKVLWSSFFNASDLLRGRYSMGKDNHGFFESLLEANPEQYQKCTNLLREITKYLKEKDSPNSKVVSLTESFKQNSYELFFFDRDEHTMRSFSNPLSISLDKPQEIFQKLLTHPGLQRSKYLRLLTTTEQNDWKNALTKYVDNPQDEVSLQKWKKWKKFLLLNDDEAKILEAWARKRGDKNISNEEKQTYYQVKNKLKYRRVIDPIQLDGWRSFMDLHKVLFQIDSCVFEEEDAYWWCHAMVPINYSRGGNMVGIMFSFRCRKLNPEDKEYDTMMDNLAYLITGALSKNMLNILIKLKDKDAMESANRYAIAAVTSRNMAHNLGSHILANLDTSAAIREFRESKKASSFDEELARFNAFIRTKTNLLADMVTSEPVSTVNKWLYKEVIDEFNRQEIVKKYISGTHIQEVNILYLDQYGSDEEDILVQIPNGDLGVGAFFMLLENIIRNSAKYEDTSKLQELNLTVAVTSSEERGYYLLLYDNIQRPKEKLDELIKSVNNRLHSQNTEIGNKIKSSGWGLTEMKAAAAYLRKKVPGIIIGVEEDQHEVPFIEAFSHPLSPETKTLAYKIYLKKPRNVIIVNHQNVFSNLKHQTFIEQGVKIISQDGLIQDSKEIHSHALMIYFEPDNRLKLKQFPLRSIFLKNKAVWLAKKMEDMTAEAFVLWAWEAWLNDYAQRKGKLLHEFKLYLLGEGVAGNSYSSSEDQLVLLDNAIGYEFLPKNISNLNDCFVYDYHGKHLPQEVAHYRSELGFYQGFSSVDPTGRIVTNVKTLTPKQQQILRLQLLEAAITTVIIIDERIQRDAIRIHNSQEQRDFFSVLTQMRIHLPNPEQQAPDLSNLQKIEEIDIWLNQAMIQYKPDFIVLHLGLLESWLGSDMDTVSKWVEGIVASWNMPCEIVLISGRGKPHQFPSSVSYQPASTLDEYIVGGPPSKYHLVQLLFSSRTRVGLI